MRKPLIAGNWKMNGNKALATELLQGLKPMSTKTDVEIVICCPFTLLEHANSICEGSTIALGAQNVCFEDRGAFTGEISVEMLKEQNVQFVIIGHSERREYFGETEDIVNMKVKKVVESGLRPIICVGESLAEKESNKTFDKVKDQVINALAGLNNSEIKNVIIAYEPIWAIGTGKTPGPQEANEVIAYIRQTLSNKFGEEISEEIRILYGGSVNSINATEFLNEEDIDGALVGGASLKLDEFISIINF